MYSLNIIFLLLQRRILHGYIFYSRLLRSSDEQHLTSLQVLHKM